MPQTFKISLARIVSVIGHPAVLLPGAMLVLMWQNLPPSLRAVYLAVGFSISSAIALWSSRQVRSGAWVHIDASHPHERKALNRVLLALFIILAFIFAALTIKILALSFLCAALIVQIARMAFVPFKVSHHVAFAVFGVNIIRNINFAYVTPF